jgi:threonyl-tRNA synthetase
LKQGFARPIIIHRAIFGSIERFMAILCEQTGGKWPFWLSPRQLKLIPISSECEAYALKIQTRLRLKGYAVEIDLKPDNLNKKIRKAQL